ncbi:histidinol-phosphate transaminase [Aeromicrobium sp. Leaf350]|uniref:histidinol-phosphate transaminase n=1 Tax=Aeromicrobium sp. Leaf350 TaxID=2876565 RepID=UPI001E590330|nr:histidinol-phosphate transaminase [Aeromicrobium sp. Leaf350]
MTTPVPRPAIAAVPPYRPGRPAVSDELKLSSNELPFAPLPGVLAAATQLLGRMNRYPDAGCTALYEALAETFEVEPDQLAAGTGSVDVLYRAIAAFAGPGDEVVLPWRSFEAYPLAVAVSGATAVTVPLRPDATHDIDAMAAAVTERTKVVLVCTPNNPTGPVVTATELEHLLARVPSHVLVVVDEAYVEFVRDPLAASGLAALQTHPNVLVLRTFSKAHGLAGLRVGYGIGSPDVIEAVRVAVPFGVTDVAQVAAIASLGETDAMRRRVETVVAERDRVATALLAAGWEVPVSEANFVWLPVGAQALAVAARCEPVSVRPFAGEGVRVTIGDPSANDLVLEALRDPV